MFHIKKDSSGEHKVAKVIARPFIGDKKVLLQGLLIGEIMQ